MATTRASFVELCQSLEDTIAHPQPETTLTNYTKQQFLNMLGEFANNLNGGTGREVKSLAVEVAFIRNLPAQIKDILQQMDQEIYSLDDLRPIKQSLLCLVIMASRNGKR